MKKQKKYIIDKKEVSIVNDVLVKYNAQRDFTTLEAWKKARLVKLFFYKESVIFFKIFTLKWKYENDETLRRPIPLYPYTLIPYTFIPKL